MSIRRLLATVAVMAAIAVVLMALTPPPATMARALIAPQRTADVQGSDALISSATGVLAWAVWAWGALGLALTAASALPGAVGAVARAALRVALPAGARRGTALVLGIGLGFTAPLAGPLLPGSTAVASAADSTAGGAPDWPTQSPEASPDAVPVPDWPAGPGTAAGAAPAGDRIVVRGDCLWHIAADSLLGQLGRLPSDAEVAVAVAAWWRANADVIGPDPDLLIPGQRLRAPDPS